MISIPIRKVKGGYKWGSKGKVYRNRKDAERQAAAAYASGYVKKGWKEILKNLDQQDWYSEADGFNANPSDEAHRAAKTLILKNFNAEQRRMIQNTPRDGEFHDVGFKLLGEPVLFKKDKTYRPVHRGEPTHFKLTNFGSGVSFVLNQLIQEIDFLRSKGVILKKSHLFFTPREESYAYYKKVKDRVNQLKQEEANPPQKKRGFFSRGK